MMNELSISDLLNEKESKTRRQKELFQQQRQPEQSSFQNLKENQEISLTYSTDSDFLGQSDKINSIRIEDMQQELAVVPEEAGEETMPLQIHNNCPTCQCGLIATLPEKQQNEFQETQPLSLLGSYLLTSQYFKNKYNDKNPSLWQEFMKQASESISQNEMQSNEQQQQESSNQSDPLLSKLESFQTSSKMQENLVSTTKTQDILKNYKKSSDQAGYQTTQVDNKAVDYKYFLMKHGSVSKQTASPSVIFKERIFRRTLNQF